MQRRKFLFGCALALVAPSTSAYGESRKTKKRRHTTVIVKDMHCAHCAKKIVRQLFKVKGVKYAKAVVKTNAATVTPEDKKQLSPKILWEAVEKAGFTPVKLIGPTGIYRKKPEA